MQSKITALWEFYYIKKPLTFWEFVKRQTNLKNLFSCVETALKTYEREFERAPYTVSEVYVTGALGVGKNVYTYLIIAYRLYLAMLLKNPKEAIFQIAPTCELSCVFIGLRHSDKLKMFLHFLREVQDEKDPIFNFNENASGITIFQNSKGVYTARYQDNEIVFKSVTGVSDLLGVNPLIVDYDAAVYDTVTSIGFLKQIQRRIDACFGFSKNLFSCLVVEKSPNNLYNDLIDQYIERTICLVERFVPMYLRDIRDADQLPKNTHFIDLLNGTVDKVGNLDTYTTTHPENIIRQFPAKVNNTNLLELAIKNPKEFINDFLGESIPVPCRVTSEFCEKLNILQNVRKMIIDNQIQFTFDKNGSYLSIVGLDTKIKL